MRHVMEKEEGGVVEVVMVDFAGIKTDDRLLARAVIVEVDGQTIYSEDFEPRHVHTVH